MSAAQDFRDTILTTYDIKKEKALMLFDLDVVGHHPTYINHLVRDWHVNNIFDRLDIVVSPQFIKLYPEIVKLAENSSKRKIRFIPITDDEYIHWSQQTKSLLKVFQEWKLFCKYARYLQINHGLLMYFDHFQLPLVLGIKPPCSISGIYFRPTFHYDDFPQYKSNWKEKLRQWRQKLILNKALQSKQLKTLYCLDPFAVKHIKKMNSKVKIIHLPDPVPISNCQDLKNKALQKRVSLEIELERKILLLFGSLDERKGINQLFASIHELSIEICEKTCILLVGKASFADKEIIENSINNITQKLPIKIIFRNQYISDEEVSSYLELADVVMAPYQQHVGMSGILLIAAAASKPVISSNYGLMGHLVEKYQLGLAIDSTSPHEIAKAITCLFNEHLQGFYNVKKMKSFVDQHLISNFVNILFNREE
jgi:glycosyltransferase involved in cell wall biosynthesis